MVNALRVGQDGVSLTPRAKLPILLTVAVHLKFLGSPRPSRPPEVRYDLKCQH